ncbi:MAG: hypothetical protein ACTHLB_20385 [Parafilimonas sp.]
MGYRRYFPAGYGFNIIFLTGQRPKGRQLKIPASGNRGFTSGHTPGASHIFNFFSAFLAQQNIVLANDAATGMATQTRDTARSLLKKQSENYRQLCDHYFSTPWAHLTGGVQFLKTFYAGKKF